MVIDGILYFIGAGIMIEAIVSLKWAYNDKKWYAQLVRVGRIIAGGAIICLVFLKSTGL